MKTDLTKSGQVFNALTTHFNFEGYEEKNVPSPPDAVIHFAAYARNMLVPDDECYAANVTSTYNVIEAACKLGVRKIIIASSETTYEVCFGQGDLDYQAFPLTEDMDLNPMDSYAISKLCGERVARGLARTLGTWVRYAIWLLRRTALGSRSSMRQTTPSQQRSPPSSFSSNTVRTRRL